MRFAKSAALMALMALSVGCREPVRPVLRIATTTSVENSGLLPAILPLFEEETGSHVEAVVVGSGRALNLARRGDVDAVITHDPEAERVFLDEGHAISYSKIMYNHFVIAGPAEDPSGIRNATGPVQAMKRIAESRSPFASRGDDSGTHSREKSLWSVAGIEPGGDWYLETGQGMSGTLRVASERSGYVLTDEATFARMASSLDLEILLEDGKELLNTYSITVVRRDDSSTLELANRLASWLTEGAGRDAIGLYLINGVKVFLPWPENEPGNVPEATPEAP